MKFAICTKFQVNRMNCVESRRGGGGPIDLSDLTESTLCLKYFRNRVIVIYGKREKEENENYENLSIFAATPSFSGRVGGGCCNPGHPPTFFTVKLFERYMGSWTKGG